MGLNRGRKYKGEAPIGQVAMSIHVCICMSVDMSAHVSTHISRNMSV